MSEGQTSYIKQTKSPTDDEGDPAGEVTSFRLSAVEHVDQLDAFARFHFTSPDGIRPFPDKNYPVNG